jgi:hypothetical protein
MPVHLQNAGECPLPSFRFENAEKKKPDFGEDWIPIHLLSLH